VSKSLADNIRACLDRAAAAERMALRENEPVAKAELMEMARSWREVAAGYQYVEKLERFLKTHRASDGPQSAH